MSLANNGGAPSTSLTDDRLSSRATTYYRWFDNRYCPASRPEQVANPNLLGVTAVSAPGLQPVATDASSTDISWASASTPPIVSVSVTELQRDPGTRERFLSVAERQIGVFDAAQRRAGTGDNPSTVVNIATPAKPDSDPADSTTWSPRRKWLLTCLVGVTMFNGSFASTAPNGASVHIVHQFGLSNEELAFVASSFVGGCVAGPIIWSPMSEVYGRRPVFLISNLLYSLTNIGCALAPNKAVLFNSRFLAGVFSSSAFSNAAAVTTDLFAPPHRAFPMVVVSLSPLLGPCFGPLFGSVVSLDLRWPWVFWFMGALGLVLQVALLFLPETYAPILIVRAKPRQIIATPVRTRRQRIVTLLVVNLARPINMILREPIVVCANFYLSFFFALMYIFFASWPLIFGPPGIYKLDTVLTSITFLPMGLGGVLAAAWLTYRELYRAKGSMPSKRPGPEVKLLPTLLVAPLVAAGLLWSGWLARTSVPYQVATLGCVPIGAAMVLVFQGWIGYLGDCYRLYASSAIAATVIGRSLSGATIPLCTHQLHEKLGGMAYLYTMLAGLVLLTTPIPFVVLRYGERLRARSMYKPAAG